MSITLQRTIIMPKLQCFCDRYWGPLDRCRLPGATKLRLPFICPMDHILEPHNLVDDPKQFGPPLPYREYSFFENARTSDLVKNGTHSLRRSALM